MQVWVCLAFIGWAGSSLQKSLCKDSTQGCVCNNAELMCSEVHSRRSCTVRP
jgi:hypothetical protein